jgi:hypothetical protein
MGNSFQHFHHDQWFLTNHNLFHNICTNCNHSFASHAVYSSQSIMALLTHHVSLSLSLIESKSVFQN